MGVAGALLPRAWCIQFRARAAIGRYGICPIEEKIPTLQLSREYIRRAGETGDGLPRSIFYKHIVDARKAARAAYATLATGNASRASKAQTMPEFMQNHTHKVDFPGWRVAICAKIPIIAYTTKTSRNIMT